MLGLVSSLLPEYLVFKKGMDMTQHQRKHNETPFLDLDIFNKTVIKKRDKCQTTLFVFKYERETVSGGSGSYVTMSIQLYPIRKQSG